LLLFAAVLFSSACGGGGAGSGSPVPSPSAMGLAKVRNVIVMMQENHSFDNYLGALPYMPSSPYHAGPCASTDNTCVDGLTCTTDVGGALTCTNSNLDAGGTPIAAFHDPRLCVSPDLDHTWTGTHHEANFLDPNSAMTGLMDGFVRQNDVSEQTDSGETATDDDTMGFYTQDDLPYYYGLAKTFALDDRYFASALTQTVPNRLYEFAGTSFGHLVTSTGESIPPDPTGYQPIHGTIFDLLDKNGVSWGEYVDTGDLTELGIPYGALVHTPDPPHFQTFDDFISQAKKGDLPSVSFVDFGISNSEHPPFDIRAGESKVADVINTVRNGPTWKTSIIILTYDEHGGAYDHVTPPAAVAPDAIPPGQCADNSDPPNSTTPGNGAQCDDSQQEAQKLCAEANPGEACSAFDQYGVRLPFIVISPFAKPSYVSHTVGDHGSILALLENRFALSERLTARDAQANDLEDLFDFDNVPSLHARIKPAFAPDPHSSDPGCN
jgi:phospholipase C